MHGFVWESVWCDRELEVYQCGRVRKSVTRGALFDVPRGEAALKLVGSNLTSTCSSFDSHSEGKESLMRPQCSGYFRGRRDNFSLEAAPLSYYT